MARKSILMQQGSGSEPGSQSRAEEYAAMSWPALQSEAASRDLLRRGMGREEIEAALLADDGAGNG